MSQLLIIFLSLLLLGFLFGRLAERNHYARISLNERKLGNIIMLADKTPPREFEGLEHTLVLGSVVISVDYFKLYQFTC